MKLKCRPEDFCVEELPLVAAEGTGRYTFYRLAKRSLGTIEAVDGICRRWNLAARSLSYGGLKDRHAVTTQYLTITDGPPKSITEPQFELQPLGRLSHPYGPRHFLGNRFVIVVRDLTADELGNIRRELALVPADGLPNYFDDQRFGSVGYSGQFIAGAWLAGEYERALRLALAEPNPFDRSRAKAQKAVLRSRWGEWPAAKARLDRSPERSIVTYLVDHPTDYRGAFARMRRELRTLYFSAYQSHLWNAILARWIERLTRPDQRVPIELKAGTLPFPRGLEPDQVRALAGPPIPLPSAREPLPSGPLGAVAQEVLKPFGLAWSDLRVRHLKDVFFSKGTRAGLVFPINLESSVLADDLYPGRQALRLSFELGKGSYATILVKRITQVADPSR
jgi:tRNA pseudouridine13 synthase